MANEGNQFNQTDWLKRRFTKDLKHKMQGEVTHKIGRPDGDWYFRYFSSSQCRSPPHCHGGTRLKWNKPKLYWHIYIFHFLVRHQCGEGIRLMIGCRNRGHFIVTQLSPVATTTNTTTTTASQHYRYRLMSGLYFKWKD